MTIAAISARPILDSRGQWTIEVTVTLSDGSVGVASAPSGKSTGSHEAKLLPVKDAVRQLETTLTEGVTGLTSHDQTKFDTILQELDGTNDKSNLGANTLLALSCANARAHAKSQQLPLWRYLATSYGTSIGVPVPHANLINGGVHAGNELPFQEYLVIPQVKSSEYAVHMITALYHKLGAILKEELGDAATLVGDEGGYAPLLKDPLEPFAYIEKARAAVSLSAEQIGFGLDAAANEVELPAEQLHELYTTMKEKYDLRYLEDPFGEDDFKNFTTLLNSTDRRCPIVGDDLTVTNIARIHKAFSEHSANGVIIKPNQIGTITEAVQATQRAHEYGWWVVVSHRSGETNDTFIVDLAVALGAQGIKLGAPARGERVAKYNRLLQVAEEVRAQTM